LATFEHLSQQKAKSRAVDPEEMLLNAGKKWRRTTDDFINQQKNGPLKALMWALFNNLKKFNNQEYA